MKFRHRIPRRLTLPMERVAEYTDIRLGAPNEARNRRQQRAMARAPQLAVPDALTTLGVPVVRAASSSISAGATADITASCNAGEFLVGGGCYAGAAASVATSCRSSYPNTPNQQWKALVFNGSAGSVTAISYAICITPKLQS